MLYVNRYIRIAPLCMFCIFFFMTLTRYIGSGPRWYHPEDFMPECDDYWYTYAIFLNNFIPDNKGNFCASYD